jgi:hypothetical protein
MHSTHSPRLSARNSNSNMMTDSPVHHGMQGNYDMMDTQQRGEDYSSDNQHSYSESDRDSSDSDASEEGGEAQLNAHTSGAQHYMHGDDDDPSSSLPSSQFTSLLSSHIKSLAEESARTPNSPFARLYKQAQQTKVKKKIKAILLRPDIKKEKKVRISLTLREYLRFPVCLLTYVRAFSRFRSSSSLLSSRHSKMEAMDRICQPPLPRTHIRCKRESKQSTIAKPHSLAASHIEFFSKRFCVLSPFCSHTS